MDWSNERYVRVYIRDTLTWKRLRFEGQTVFLHVCRKLNRAGRLDLDGMGPAEALSILTDVPEDFAAVGFEKLLDLEVFKVVDGALVAPNFVEAQESKATDAQRQRESRAKQKDIASVTPCDPMSQNVTPASRTVTGGHDESHPVTPSLAEPSRAVSVSAPAQAEFEMAHGSWASGRDRDAETLRGKALTEATQRAQDVAKRLGLSLAQAVPLLCDAALSLQKSTGKPWAFALREAQVKRGPVAISPADLDADLAVFQRRASQ